MRARCYYRGAGMASWRIADFGLWIAELLSSSPQSAIPNPHSAII